MPSRPMRPCAYPGCSELVRSGRCERHRAETQAAENAQRDPRVKRLYNSARWLGIRAGVLARSPWCEVCLAEGRYTVARHVDHINPHGGDVGKFYAGPFQALCIECHSRKTLSEIRGRGAEKESSREDPNAAGHPREKKSPISAREM